MSNQTLMWLIFNAAIAVILYVDLFLLNKHAHKVSLKEAAFWCGIWVLSAMLFDLGIYLELGKEKALAFLTGYVIEYSLSMDNMFVFVMIFSYFSIAEENQPRILRWGILGAIIMRFILIFTGVALIHRFHWLIYVFGAVLIYTGLKMLKDEDNRIDPGQNPLLKLFKKLLRFDAEYKGEKFFITKNAKFYATTLFATLIVIEVSDLIFALDSIPAILAISQDSFIVYTSNVFAILGLRALYFLLAGIMGLFAYLKYGISVILSFVGVKMLISGVYHIPTGLSLLVVVGILAIAVAASLLFKKTPEEN